MVFNFLEDFRMNRMRRVGGLSVVVLMTVVLAGCGTGGSRKAEESKVVPVAESKKSDDHSGWWCAEHGVPEHDCAQCNTKVAAEYKKKGDWCKEHDRPDSQCFICHPELKEKFAAQYRAKYGKEPPPIEDEEESKNGKK
jgi:hypothetical protein